ncbi:acidic phospholipase A2 KBf-grIB-like [Salminus brasiliensis]|uniref:acidic phospholipase A2 KBf-grIB-like n=1 Tax=Salminus brasiliensis TaxID=930266 RepID=UPI003B838509
MVPIAFYHFGDMIDCTTESMGSLKYIDYGCYCGIGGSGTPVDSLDQCCYEHDKCYGRIKKRECSGIFNLPYIKSYKYECFGGEVTCSASNDKCQAAVCECDRDAAHCIGQHHHTYNSEYFNYDQEKCK